MQIYKINFCVRTFACVLTRQASQGPPAGVRKKSSSQLQFPVPSPSSASGRRRSSPAMSSFDQALSSTLLQLFRAYDGAFLGVGLALLAGKTLFDYRSNSAALDKVLAAPSVSPSDLRAILPKDDDGGGERSWPLVVVRGHVHPKSSLDTKWFGGRAAPLLSTNSGFKAVFVEHSQSVIFLSTEMLTKWALF